MITINLPILQVLIPLVAAPICSMLWFKRGAWAFSVIVTFATFACAVNLLLSLYSGGELLYTMGGWIAPYGIGYRIDALSALFLVLISGIGSVCIIYGLNSVEREIEATKQPFFYSLYLLAMAGMLGIVATNDIFNIYVFLEISSLATYALVAMGKDKRALIAAFEYLILGTIGATFILIAIGLIYAMTGSLNISDITLRIKPILSSMPIKMAIAFFTVGLALKIAAFPLHLWLTNAYTNAPSFVSAFLCATATKVGVYIIIRLLFYMFGMEFSFITLPIGQIFIILGMLGMVVGSIVALMQDNVKRMLAYSSVAQIGYILIGIGIANAQGLSASLLHIGFHAIAKSSLFMAAGAVLFSVKGVRIEYFRGIGRRMPVTMAVFIISGLSLAGVPGTAGFISKWYLMQSALAADMWPVFVAIILSSVITLIYVWKVVETAFFGYIEHGRGNINEAPILMLVPMVVLSALSVIIGVCPGYVSLYINVVVERLLAM